jgi:hypothetical protein
MKKNVANIEDALKSYIGKEIEINYSYHEEGVLRYTRGVLIDVKKDMIVLKIKDKDHWWQRLRPHIYFLNRHACILASVVIHDAESSFAEEQSDEDQCDKNHNN